MISRFARLSAMSVFGLSLALFSSCASNVQTIDMTEAITYKTVDEGTLNISIKGKPFSSETYTIQRGSDNTWSTVAKVTSATEVEGTRDVRIDLGDGLQPQAYEEESTGAAPLKLYIAFLPDSASVSVEKEGQAPIQSSIPGKFDVVLPEFLLGARTAALYHVSALITKNYVERNVTGEIELTALGSPKPIKVNELEEVTLKSGGGDVVLRHFTIDTTGGKLLQHVWTRKDDMTLVKAELPRLITAEKEGIEGLSELTGARKRVKKAKPVAAETTTVHPDSEGKDADDSGPHHGHGSDAHGAGEVDGAAK